jgi:hypothetical protein
MADPFDSHQSRLDSPAASAFAITPDDDADLPRTVRAIYVSGAGDVVCILDEDTAAVTFEDVPAGSILPVRARRVMETTTATSLIGLL